MKIKNLRVEELMSLHESKESPLKIHFKGRDLADLYYIIDTAHHSDEESRFYFLLYLEDDLNKPHEAIRCDSMTDAAMHLAYRFILDNCDQETDASGREQEMLRQLTTYQ